MIPLTQPSPTCLRRSGFAQAGKGERERIVRALKPSPLVGEGWVRGSLLRYLG